MCQLECFCTKNAYVGVEGENDWVVVVAAVSLRTRGRDINDLFPVHLFFFSVLKKILNVCESSQEGKVTDLW